MQYLDHNATTSPHPKVRELLISLASESYNASSIHEQGRKARKLIEQAREQIAASIGIDSYSKDYQVIFTSSGTESNNLIINSYSDGEIFISGVEHPSIYEYVKYASNIKIIKVDNHGIVDLTDLERLLAQSNARQKLVSVMLANNESGILQNIAQVASIAKKYGAECHSDCVQAFGKIPLNIKQLGADFITLSAHKIGGIQGSSALISKTKYALKPTIIGGGQEENIRAGTENVISIACFGMAAIIASTELKERYEKMKVLQQELERNLLKYDKVEIIAKDKERLPNTSLILVPGTNAQEKLIAFDLLGIYISSGSACSSGKVGKSHVLTAMGISDEKARSSIRVSFSHNQTQEDIKTFIKAFYEIYKAELI